MRQIWCNAFFLTGYGVELAIKSTEYKASDDSEVKGWFLLDFY